MKRNTLLSVGFAVLAAFVVRGEGFGLKAVQLDLARQIETVPFVKDFLRRSAAAGFDTVVLYLEDRLKTPSYPYSDDEESYSIAEMKEIVETAAGLGVDIVPVVSPLGHTDRFHRHDELKAYAETHECDGRYSSVPKAFCLENPEARRWMEKYLDEVIAVFPGANFHMGFDETDDLGFCRRCRPIMEREGLGSLFVKHLKWAHGIAARHGKRLWIWDDYFMFFPEKLKEIPRDVVMCAWNYCPDLETTGLRNNFGGRLRRDVMREYEKLGFDCVLCPWFDTDNIVRITEYAASRKPFGMLQTQWEMAGDFHGCYYPRALGALELWKGGSPVFGDRWLAAGIRAAMPSLSEAEIGAAVTLLLYQSRMRLRSPTLASCADAGVPVSAIAAWKNALGVLKKSSLRPGTGPIHAIALDERALLDDIVTRSEAVVILGEARNAGRCLVDPARIGATSKEAKKTLQAMVPRWKELCARRLRQWEAWRPGKPKSLLSLDDSFTGFVDSALAVDDVASENEWILEADITMTDAYGVPYWRVEGLFDGKWKPLGSGVWKPSTLSAAYLAKRLSLRLEKAPTALKIAYRGYGAGEMCHISLYNRSRRLVPGSILSADDGVRNVANLLIDDFRSARFGEPDAVGAILDPKLADREHTVVLGLK